MAFFNFTSPHQRTKRRTPEIMHDGYFSINSRCSGTQLFIWFSNLYTNTLSNHSLPSSLK